MYDTLPALKRGANKADEWIRSARLEQYSVEEYRSLGLLYARTHFKREETRQQFMRGWYDVGQRFFGMMKPSHERLKQIKTVATDLIIRFLDALPVEYDEEMDATITFIACRVGSLVFADGAMCREVVSFGRRRMIVAEVFNSIVEFEED